VGSGDDATVRFLRCADPVFTVDVLFAQQRAQVGFSRPELWLEQHEWYLEFALPYYWNIAPNMDATIEPRLLTKRGLQLGSEFRYLDAALGGSYNGRRTWNICRTTARRIPIAGEWLCVTARRRPAASPEC
jgi:LPS-assembly protein